MDFASIRIFVDGTAVDLNQVTFEDFSLELDMKRGEFYVGVLSIAIPKQSLKFVFLFGVS